MHSGTRWMGTLLVGTALVGATLALASGVKPEAKAQPAKAGSAESRKAMIARGEYLVTVIGCGDCHTPGTFYGGPNPKRLLAGSEMGWRGPWGVTFARNLTPDLDTGLGYWSESEIVAALRTGVTNQGRTLMPPMPWQDFSRLSDADAHAIAAYLLNLPPVHHKVPDPVPPGGSYSGPAFEFPPPTAWDAPAAPDSTAMKK